MPEKFTEMLVDHCLKTYEDIALYLIECIEDGEHNLLFLAVEDAKKALDNLDKAMSASFTITTTQVENDEAGNTVFNVESWGETHDDIPVEVIVNALNSLVDDIIEDRNAPPPTIH